MKKSLYFTLIVCWLISAFSVPAHGNSGADILPAPGELTDWTLQGKVITYAANDMWKHINGAADQYLHYDCNSLTVCYYGRSSKDDEIAVEIYDMKKPLLAFGIFSAQRPDTIVLLDIGSQAYQEANTLNVYHGPFYIKLQVFPDNADNIKTMADLAKLLVKKITVDKKIPYEFSIFPKADIIDNSYMYIHQGALGMKELEHAYSADYKVRNKNIKVLLIRLTDEQQAQTTLETFTKSISRRCDTAPKSLSLENITGVQGNDRYSGPFFAFSQKGEFIVVQGETDLEWAHKTVLSMIKNLNSKQVRSKE